MENHITQSPYLFIQIHEHNRLSALAFQSVPADTQAILN